MKSVLYLWISLLLSLFIRDVEANIFASTVKIKQLPYREMVMLNALEKFLYGATRENDINRETLWRFLQNSSRDNRKAKEDEAFLERPTNAFYLVKRMSSDWRDISKLICENEIDASQRKIEYCASFEAESITNWPTDDDLKGAALAMIRLVDFYQLDPVELANGRIYGVEMQPLDVEDFWLIAQVAVDDNQDLLASQWYQNTVTVVDILQPENVEMRTRLRRRLAQIYYKNSMICKAVDVLKKARREDPDHTGLQRDMELYKSRCDRGQISDQGQTIARPDFFIPNVILTTYRDLCRRDLKTAVEKSKLFCSFRPTIVPFIFSKLEYAHLDPPIVIFHGIITEKEIRRAKEMAMENLHRSSTGSAADMSEEEALKAIEKLNDWCWNEENPYSMRSIRTGRVFENAWLDDGDEIMAGLTRKVELHTGYKAMFSVTYSQAEKWQILNYGMGGLYVPHDDTVQDIVQSGPEWEKDMSLRFSGDRMATFLFYLNDVIAGGSTVYPRLKTRVTVVKGSAVLWHNVMLSGAPDRRVLHAGCPVLIGSKWVANKWIREIGQAFTRKCALDPKL